MLTCRAMKPSNNILVFMLLFVYTIQAQVSGCTDPLSKNYNPLATVNDGSCKYNSVTISPVTSVNLPAEVKETSGLIKWREHLYTHNDNGDTNLYELDSLGSITKVLPIKGNINKDWEEIAQDEKYFYIGDFGNNVKGNRTNLTIIKINKDSLFTGNSKIEHINFSYSDQTDFTPRKNNNTTDFDCEAFIVSNDSIYLFTKQWVSKKTSIYTLPKAAGTYIAKLKTTYNVDGLITAATYLQHKKLIVLSGYSGLLQPFFYLLYDFANDDFFSGNKRKITMSMSFNQTEGVATTNGTDIFVTNEYFSQRPFVNTPQKLHRFNLSPYLSNYLENFDLSIMQRNMGGLIQVYPEPLRNKVRIETAPNLIGADYNFIDNKGNKVLRGKINNKTNKVDMSQLPKGIYTLKVSGHPDYEYKLVSE